HDEVGLRAPWHLRELAEYERKDGNRSDRLHHGPGYPENSLLVAHLHVPPRQETKQFAVVPKVPPVMGLHSTRLKHKHGGGGRDVFGCGHRGLRRIRGTGATVKAKP